MQSNIFIIIASLIFFTHANASSKEAKYECRPDEVIDVNTGKTVNKITDTRTAIMLTVSDDKIFDGTFWYTFSKSDNYDDGIVNIYKHAPSGRSIIFPTFPREKNNEVDIRYIVYGDPQTTVGLFFNCFNFEQIEACRAKLNKSK